MLRRKKRKQRDRLEWLFDRIIEAEEREIRKEVVERFTEAAREQIVQKLAASGWSIEAIAHEGLKLGVRLDLKLTGPDKRMVTTRKDEPCTNCGFGAYTKTTGRSGE